MNAEIIFWASVTVLSCLRLVVLMLRDDGPVPGGWFWLFLALSAFILTIMAICHSPFTVELHEPSAI